VAGVAEGLRCAKGVKRGARAFWHPGRLIYINVSYPDAPRF